MKINKKQHKPNQAEPSRKMSQSVELNAVEVIKIKVKRKVKSKLPVVAVATADEEPQMKKSIWMHMRRTPKEKRKPIVWEDIEDISDDENDTPQAAEERVCMIKENKTRLQRRVYESKLDELQGAGLFLNWAEEKPLEIHPNQFFIDGQEYILTWVYN